MASPIASSGRLIPSVRRIVVSIAAEIKDLSRCLRQLDASPKRYKKSIHCGPPLTEAELSAFESDFGIMLPPSYRSFLSECGDGSIGPGLGVLPLHRWHLVLETAPAIRETLSANCLLTPDLCDSASEWLKKVGPSNFEEQLVNETWSPYQGCITISDLGCCTYAVMPANGPFTGTVWQVDHDYRPPTLYPFDTFTAWLLDWCKAELSQQSK